MPDLTREDLEMIDANYFGDEPEYEDEFDCHMMHDGSCGAAGSEDCEFECPYRARQRVEAVQRRERVAATRRSKSPQGRLAL